MVRALQFVEELVVADLDLVPGTAPMQAELAEGTVPAEPGQSGMIITRHHISDAGDAPAELITPVVAKPLRGDGRGLSRSGHGPAGLLPQERHRAGLPRSVRWHRLHARGHLGMRRPRRRPRLRHLQSQRLLLGALQERRRRAGRSGRACISRPCRSPLPSTRSIRCSISTASPPRTCRPGSAP